MRGVARFGVLLLLATLLSSVGGLVAPSTAVSSNPTPDCSAGSTCTMTFTYSGDFYEWTVPAGISQISFDVRGAEGGASVGYASSPGKGMRLEATVNVTAGNQLRILVGGKGQAQRSNAGGGGGGGGSFVATSSGTPLVVAGGGGGAGGRDGSNGQNGSSSTSGSLDSSSRGTAGSSGAGALGGTSAYPGGGGGGFSSNGSSGSGNVNAEGGKSFVNGGTGGVASSGGYPANGGFGGGGAVAFAGGGGGGYSGGAGGNGDEPYPGGGGGGSFVATGSTNLKTSTGQYSSSSTFGGLQIVNLASYNSGNGLVTATYLNAPQVSTFTSAQSNPTNSTSAVSYSLSFSQNVNTVASSDFSNAGTATGCTFTPSASSGTNFTLSITGCSEGTLQPQVLANQVFGTVTNSNGPSANSPASTTITIDRTAPTIAANGVTAPSDGTYSPTGLPLGPTLSFSVLMSESVTVTGSPRLTLTVGSATRYATYLSQSDSRTLTFQYTPATSLDEIDSDGISMASSLDLNGGSIADLASNSLSDTSLTPPTLTGVRVAQRASAPTITSITAGNTQLSVAFTAGDSNGAAITNYKYSLGGGSFTALPTPDTITPLVITGLTNGTSYAVRILAVTAVGDGESSTAVTATPTSIVVANGSDISVTYGSVGTSSAFTASGGTSPYTFSLSPSVAGVSIDPSTGVVTTSASLAAGSYSTFVVATDSASRSGQKAISILVSQDTPTISIALTGGVSSAPLGAAISIIATVSEEGSVAFFLGGASITGCSAVASSSGTATCSWTPGSLGSVSLSAVLTPTDSANYLSETSSALSITVVTGTSAISLSLSGTPTKGATLTITATTTDIAGSVAFFLNGKRIIGCTNKAVSSGTATCLWKLSRHGEQTLSARFTPTNNAYRASSAQVKVVGLRRVSR